MKNALALCLSILFCGINAYADAIGYNDGSAFISKAEFDALKSSFQSKIDEYNSNIDSKIDNAIASYLSGIRISNELEIAPYISGKVWSVSETYRPRYVYAPPQAKGNDYGIEWNNTEPITNRKGFMFGWKNTVTNLKSFDDANYGQSKLWINNLDVAKKIAAWQGYDVGAKDKIDVENTQVGDRFMWSSSWTGFFQVSGNQSKNYIYEDQDLKGKSLLFWCNTSSINNYSMGEGWAFINEITNSYGTKHMDNIVLFDNSVEYDCFSNKDETRNWRYKGTSEDLYQTWSTSADVLDDIKGMYTTSDSTTGTAAYSTSWYTAPVKRGTGEMSVGKGSGSIRVSAKGYRYVGSSGDRSSYNFTDGMKWYWLGAGFETKYLTDFNQLYNPNLDDLARRMKSNGIKGHNTLIADSDGTLHIGIVAGLPIALLNANQILKMDLDIKDIAIETDRSKTTDYAKATEDTSFKKMIVWAKTSPFTTDDPNSEANLEIKGTNVVKATDPEVNKGYVLTKTDDNPVKIEIQVPENCIVWLKWSKDTDKGGGVVEVPEKVIIRNEAKE